MGLKTTLMAGGSMMLVGGALVITGLSTGAKTSFTWDNGPKIVETHSLNKTFNNKDFKKVTIDSGANSYVRIVRGNQWQVSGKYLDGNADLSTVNNELKLALREPKNSVFGFKESDQTAVVTVPYKVNLDDLNINTVGSGLNTLDVLGLSVIVITTYGDVLLIVI